MSEYWKSTPKYWCKHCSTYVRDTKIEKQNHEATGRHQGNLKRFLRDIHKNGEREEREKQRAKAEVERLNGVVSGPDQFAPSKAPEASKPQVSKSKPDKRQATAADRKAQLAQLAEMGIAIPDEYRGEMAMAGDWQRVSLVGCDNVDGTPREGSHSSGVRKRRLSNEDSELADMGAHMAKHPRWGSTTKTYPGYEQQDSDLDALLANVSGISTNKLQNSLPGERSFAPAQVKRSRSNSLGSEVQAKFESKEEEGEDYGVKKEESPGAVDLGASGVQMKAKPAETGNVDDAVTFKKRKKKKPRG